MMTSPKLRVVRCCNLVCPNPIPYSLYEMLHVYNLCSSTKDKFVTSHAVALFTCNSPTASINQLLAVTLLTVQATV